MSKMINPKYEGHKVAYLDNDFIRKSTALQPLTELEINLLIFMCYKAKENVDPITGEGWTERIHIDVKKFFEGIGYCKEWYDYTDDEKTSIYVRLREMQKKTFEIKTEAYRQLDKKGRPLPIYESFNYFSYLRYNYETGELLIDMPKETQRFLMNYKTGFTPVEFKNMVKLKSKYAKILYLFFRSYRDGVDHTDYTLEHLRQLLGLENKYPKWADFKRYVLIPAMEEINGKTDICVIGKRDVYYDGLQGRKPDSLTTEEYAKIVVDSMARKGDKGKAIYKITFRVSKSDNVVDDKLDFSGLLPDMEK